MSVAGVQREGVFGDGVLDADEERDYIRRLHRKHNRDLRKHAEAGEILDAAGKDVRLLQRINDWDRMMMSEIAEADEKSRRIEETGEVIDMSFQRDRVSQMVHGLKMLTREAKRTHGIVYAVRHHPRFHS